jgi:hypothetical protein
VASPMLELTKREAPAPVPPPPQPIERVPAARPPQNPIPLPPMPTGDGIEMVKYVEDVFQALDERDWGALSSW